MIGFGGIAATVLLALFVHHEASYDQFHEKTDRIVSMNRITTEPNGDRSTSA